MGSHNPGLPCLLGRGFHTLIKGVLFSSPTDVGSHNPTSSLELVPSSNRFGTLIHPHLGPVFLLAHRLVSNPFRGTASSLARRPVSNSDTICNGPSPRLASIILFGFFFLNFTTCLLGRGFHTLIKGVWFSSPTDVGSHETI